MKINLNNFEKFETRHNSVSGAQLSEMLKVVKADSLDQLIEETIPQNIRLKKRLNLPEAKTEFDFLKEFKALAVKNKLFKSYIGLGYHNCITPNVIVRNILENPGWYTAYTPYQAEIAQGRLEMLLNFQTLISDLTGMEIANASLLDEGTAAAEAMSMFRATRKKDKKTANKFFVADTCLPQTIDILKTRCEPIGVELEVGDYTTLALTDENLFGVLLQYPEVNGEVVDYTDLISKAHDNNVKVAVAADILSLTLLTPPGEMGADAVVGTTQRLGVPMGYGGPHAAYFATKDEFKRLIPGRIIGVSKDAEGNTAYRMALQTREQHIKRERATSNICTAQVLLAVISAAYAVYHGPEGLKNIGLRVHGLSKLLADSLSKAGLSLENKVFFDTLTIAVQSSENQQKVKEEALAQEINFRYIGDSQIGIALDETTTVADVAQIVAIFEKALGLNTQVDVATLAENIELAIPQTIARKSDYLSHPSFHKYRTEHELLRYLKRLENKDLSLVHSMISLGSCTMKLNATTEMIPITWPEFGQLHPFVPVDQAEGYAELFKNFENFLCEITGFDAVSLQPNSGAQGEYAGLMTIRDFFKAQGQAHRNVALIPSSAHGTNPASAIMAGMKVVIVKCDEHGNIDVTDLKEKAEQHQENLAALLVTYPSTHGVFEEAIMEICKITHDNGGRVYMDGANLNAQVGLTNPGFIGADVCHLNLHKTFCIPHGGGGPGMGPIGVTKELAPYLPNHPVVDINGGASSAVSAAPWGSASILGISYAYIAMMGTEGLENATKTAILNANYLKEQLSKHFPILYTGKNNRCAHEMIVDCREFKKHGVEVEDIAKRLMDYGYHAPTVSFPVPGTLMIEPTESESKEELDRFCDTLISIRKEIQEVIDGKADAQNNVLKNAPHTATMATTGEWDYPYSIEQAVYPLAFVKERKFWPSVRRVDNAYGDRNLVCSCLPVEEYIEEEEVTQ
ncbi:aminomethyl-transferring glycine dehydrogenase [Rapidithrix thailandica]|uniref:Glycine dehydrogenase (decarboxylating) n=1 Tax=Rapidithrix thailandica TaxID=413964 RepID=A0AAW9S5D3_9BACT